jgi:heme-degrading monooxygenase HmoA
VEGDDVYARVAVYRIKSGTAQEIARKADDEGGMLKIFRAHIGFDSYELVGVGDTLISISRWQTEEQADAGSMAARSWVAEHLGGSVQLEADHVGELVLSSLTPDAVGL